MKRSISLVLVIILSLSLFGMSFSASATEEKPLTHPLLELINNKRFELGLAPLTQLPLLDNAAQTRSAELSDSLSHYRPDGTPWYTAIEATGLIYDTNSEECIGANYSTPKAFFDALMASSENKEKLLSDKVSHIGIGYTKGLSVNKNCYSLITLSCNYVTEAQVVKGCGDIHVPAGTNPSSWGLTVKTTCPHGSAYLPLHNNMVKGYVKGTIGSTTLTLLYSNREMCTFNVALDYTDVEYPSWYYDAVLYCTDRGYMSGIGSYKFGTDMSMTRAMFVTVIGKHAGIDTSKYTKSDFTDVSADIWYAPYVAWAAENGIVAGIGGNTFAPNNHITRQGICTLIKNYLEYKGVEPEEIYAKKEFKDESDIGDWAKDAVFYCQTRGIISGTDLGKIEPKRTATRTSAAVLIKNMDTVYLNSIS